ncbi:MAG: hypothetical protein AAGI25_09460 [Bacteroidota bacterium]
MQGFRADASIFGALKKYKHTSSPCCLVSDTPVTFSASPIYSPFKIMDGLMLLASVTNLWKTKLILAAEKAPNGASVVESE